jgi:hypothetical protein
MRRPEMEKNRSDKLPGVGVMQTAIAKREIFADDARLTRFQKHLRHEGGCIGADQREQNNSLPLPPWASRQRLFSPRQPHRLKGYRNAVRLSMQKSAGWRGRGDCRSYAGTRTRSERSRTLNSTGQFPTSSPSTSTGTGSSLSTRRCRV